MDKRLEFRLKKSVVCTRHLMEQGLQLPPECDRYIDGVLQRRYAQKELRAIVLQLHRCLLQASVPGRLHEEVELLKEDFMALAEGL